MFESKEPEYPLQFSFKKRWFDVYLLLFVTNILVVLEAFTKLDVNEISYSVFLISSYFLLALFYLREYYYKTNRKYPDLQIEEDGFFVWTDYWQSRKVYYWWDNMDSLAKRDFKKNIGIVYSSNVAFEHETGIHEGNERKFIFKRFENQVEIASAIVLSYNQHKKEKFKIV